MIEEKQLCVLKLRVSIGRSIRVLSRLEAASMPAIDLV
jgi:hypothetical protein